MRKTILYTLAFLFSSLVIPGLAGAEDVGFVKTMEGELYVMRDARKEVVNPGMQLWAGDKVYTGADGKAGIVFRDGTVVTLGNNSVFDIRGYTFLPSENEYDFSMYMEKGEMLYTSGKLGKLAPEKVKLATPRATVGVRGTRFLVSVR